MADAHDAFRGHLRELWPFVRPYVERGVTMTAAEARVMLDQHLADTPYAGEAMLLADRLHALLDRKPEWEERGQCAVLCAAVLYFLEIDDAWSDDTAGGLSDDARVIRAAELALDGA
ncbi:hypothetical protein GCM10009623_26950 [Nocardioides aestuarii]|uniref:Uncharacterized protein n=1 Tax=Nocardioides aestuarii TaxID=252231 RepID=A0ABW4TQ04_9ACTN